MAGLKNIALSLFFMMVFVNAKAEIEPLVSIDTTHRLSATIIAGGGIYAGVMANAYYLWYKDNPGSSFHWVNDNASWLQIDKVGHATTGYAFSEYSYNILSWAGLNNKKAAINGSLIGFGVLTSMEIVDGFQSEWGASWGDILANASGPLLYSIQQVVWEDQRVRMKFSYRPSEKYVSLNPSKLGDTHLRRVFSDYNSQTYWLTANVSSFISRPTKIPKWLNIVFGYGGRGLGVPPQFDDSGIIVPDFIRTREYYLSLDVDLQRIPTKSKFLKTLFEVVGFVKVPFPAIEYNKVDRFKWHWMYF
ncbi:MAG: hypothetical protein ACI9IP_002726 [Arcticibacterium sp.]|jgi:hypothetical protein